MPRITQLPPLTKVLAAVGSTYAAWKVAKYAYRYFKFLRFYRGMPTPGFIPVIGSVHKLTSAYNLYDFLLKCADKYSNYPYFVFWNLSQPIVFPTQPETFETILNSNTAVDKNYYFISNWIGDGLLCSNGEKWKMHRQKLRAAFNTDCLTSYLPIFNEHGEMFVQRVADSQQKEIEFYYLTAEIFLNSLLSTLMGLGQNEQGFVTEQMKLNHLKTVRRLSDLCLVYKFDKDLFGKYLAGIMPTGREFHREKKKSDAFTKMILNERAKVYMKNQNEGKQKDSNCFIDLLLELKYKHKLFTDEEIFDELHTFTFAGFDTTTTSLCWTMHFLASHPEAQKKLQEELMQSRHLIEKDAKINIDSIDVLNNFPYLECVIKESQRMMSPVPVTSREINNESHLRLTKPLLLDKCPISEAPLIGELPSGSQVVLSYFLLHRNKKVWGEDANEYKPERFLPENSASRHPHAFTPFAAGPRSCLGQRFSMLELKIMIIHLFSAYNFTTKQTLEMTKPFIGLTLDPTASILVYATPRVFEKFKAL